MSSDKQSSDKQSSDKQDSSAGENIKALQSFLCSMNLQNYLRSFIDQGWDDLNFLLTRTESQVLKLAKDAGLLQGHAAKLWGGLSKRRKEISKTPSITCENGVDAQRSERKVATQGASTYIGVIVDRSGSMISMDVPAAEGFNKFIQDQKKEDGICHATITRFDDVVEILKHGVELSDIGIADHKMFEPRGTTALFDAIGMTITAVEKKVAELKPDRIMIMILTDGAENSSFDYSRGTVMKMIERLKAKDWEFIFVGANQDAIQTGSRIGIKSANCLTFSTQCSSETWSAMSTNLTRYRTCPAKCNGFSVQERTSTVATSTGCNENSNVTSDPFLFNQDYQF